MKNLNQKIFAALVPSQFDDKFGNKSRKYRFVIYSIFVTHLHYDLHTPSLVKRLKDLKCEKLFIHNIIPFGEESTILLNDHIHYLPISSENPYFVMQNITIKKFFTKECFNEIINEKMKKFDNSPMINHSIFIFNVIPFPFIVACFKMNNFLLTGGSTTKRGLLSTAQHKISQFITCLEGMSKNTVFDSFHNYEKLASQPIFDHTVLNKISSSIEIVKFFNILEQYFKFKLNVDPNVRNFSWDLKKNGEFCLNLEEFLEFYKNAIENRDK